MNQQQFYMQVVLAVAVARILEFVKHSNWPIFRWVSTNNPASTKIASGISAFFVALGITFSHTGSVWDAGGLSVTLSHITLAGMLNGVGAFFLQWLLQHGFWKTIWAPPLAVPQANSPADLLRPPAPK
jgi:hypothetical protein